MKILSERPWLITLSITGIILFLFFVVGSHTSYAQGASDWDAWRTYIPGGMHRAGGLAGLVQSIINAALLLAAVIAVAYLIIGGYKYVTSSGNAEAVEAAKSTIMNAIIGLVIIFAAYVIIDFVYGILNPSTPVIPIPGGGA